MKTTIGRINLLMLLGLFIFSPAAFAQEDMDILGNVEDSENYETLELIKMDPELSTFVDLFEKSGLETSMEYIDGLTLFIPTNEAFEIMPREKYNKLTDPTNKAELAAFINYHILPRKYYKIDFKESHFKETAKEEEITVSTSMEGREVTIGGAEIIKSDIVGSDGIIHIVSAVIEPTENVVND